mmetsp:Transcript_23916/g.51654  ORF Transcript_23916/g.51654 Transcript_23916/m.51654 type:complete len:204 (+) Transcript_23916:1606-2217(+)
MLNVLRWHVVSVARVGVGRWFGCLPWFGRGGASRRFSILFFPRRSCCCCPRRIVFQRNIRITGPNSCNIILHIHLLPNLPQLIVFLVCSSITLHMRQRRRLLHRRSRRYMKTNPLTHIRIFRTHYHDLGSPCLQRECFSGYGIGWNDYLVHGALVLVGGSSSSIRRGIHGSIGVASAGHFRLESPHRGKVRILNDVIHIGKSS